MLIYELYFFDNKNVDSYKESPSFCTMLQFYYTTNSNLSVQSVLS